MKKQLTKLICLAVAFLSWPTMMQAIDDDTLAKFTTAPTVKGDEADVISVFSDLYDNQIGVSLGTAITSNGGDICSKIISTKTDYFIYINDIKDDSQGIIFAEPVNTTEFDVISFDLYALNGGSNGIRPRIKLIDADGKSVVTTKDRAFPSGFKAVLDTWCTWQANIYDLLDDAGDNIDRTRIKAIWLFDYYGNRSFFLDNLLFKKSTEDAVMDNLLVKAPTPKAAAEDVLPVFSEHYAGTVGATIETVSGSVVCRRIITSKFGSKDFILYVENSSGGANNRIKFKTPVDASIYDTLYVDVYPITGGNNGLRPRIYMEDESGVGSATTTKVMWTKLGKAPINKWTTYAISVQEIIDNQSTKSAINAIKKFWIFDNEGGSRTMFFDNIYFKKADGKMLVNDEPVTITSETLAGQTDVTLNGHVTKNVVSLLNAAGLTSMDLTGTTSIASGLLPQYINCLVYAANHTGLSKNEIIDGTCASLELQDDTQHGFHAPTAFTATVAQLKRTFSAAGIYSFVAPFDVTDIPAGITARQFVGIGEGKVTFAKIDALTANQPYLIEVESSGEYTFEASSVSVPVTNPGESAAVDGYVFTAVMTPTAAGEITGSYVLDADGSGFVKAKATTRVGSMRAYLKAPDAPEARLSILFDDDNTTGISKTQETTASQHVYYNLNGQRVEKPTKGLYIQNSRKVVIK